MLSSPPSQKQLPVSKNMEAQQALLLFLCKDPSPSIHPPIHPLKTADVLSSSAAGSLCAQLCLCPYRRSKISFVLLGVAFTPMKGERKLSQEIWQKAFGNVIDCRWQPSGGLFGPQWFFVMTRSAIIQQDEAVFPLEYASVLFWQLQYHSTNL